MDSARLGGRPPSSCAAQTNRDAAHVASAASRPRARPASPGIAVLACRGAPYPAREPLELPGSPPRACARGGRRACAGVRVRGRVRACVCPSVPGLEPRNGARALTPLHTHYSQEYTALAVSPTLRSKLPLGVLSDDDEGTLRSTTALAVSPTLRSKLPLGVLSDDDEGTQERESPKHADATAHARHRSRRGNRARLINDLSLPQHPTHCRARVQQLRPIPGPRQQRTSGDTDCSSPQPRVQPGPWRHRAACDRAPRLLVSLHPVTHCTRPTTSPIARLASPAWRSRKAPELILHFLQKPAAGPPRFFEIPGPLFPATFRPKET